MFADLAARSISPEAVRGALESALHRVLRGRIPETMSDIQRLLEACARDRVMRRMLTEELTRVGEKFDLCVDLYEKIDSAIDDDELELIAGGDYDAEGKSWSHIAWSMLLFAADIVDPRRYGHYAETMPVQKH